MCSHNYRTLGVSDDVYFVVSAHDERMKKELNMFN